MKSILTLVLIVATFTGFAQKKNALTGKWQNPKGDGRIEFKKRGSKYYGKLYWLEKPNKDDGSPKIDENNPDPALRGRKIMGIELIRDLADKGAGLYEDGFVYEPKTGKEFNCTVKVLEDGRLEMHGFIGVAMLGRTEIWTRIN